jgi:sugar-specific transcriptional regulator TrmB
MVQKEILETLKKFGLNEYEARAYVSLVLMGPSKAGDISKNSDVPQSKIYEVLEQLTYKQLVEVLGGRPLEFKAVLPEIALKNMLNNKEKEIGDLKSDIKILSNSLKPAGGGNTIVGGIWSIKSKTRDEFFNKTIEMFGRAREYAYAVTRDFSRPPRLADIVKKCIRKGVKIKIIGMEAVNSISYHRAKWYRKDGAEIKFFETKVHPRIVVIDGKEVLMRLDNDTKKETDFQFNSIWSQDPSLVKVIDFYVKNLWDTAKAIDLRKIPEEEEQVAEGDYEEMGKAMTAFIRNLLITQKFSPNEIVFKTVSEKDENDVEVS